MDGGISQGINVSLLCSREASWLLLNLLVLGNILDPGG
jgi:hypothetical protein